MQLLPHTTMSDECYRGLFQADLVRKIGKLEAQLRYANAKEQAAMRLAWDYENLVPDPAASGSERTTEPARVLRLPAPAPAVEGRSGQLVQAPALSSPVRRSVRITAMRDRPEMERSAHNRTQAYYRDGDSPASPSPPIILARTNRRRHDQSAGTDTQAQVPTSTLPVARSRFSTHDARNSLLRDAGVHRSMALTSEDLDLISRTPDITPQSFTTLFGGIPIHERPVVPASKKCDLLCVNKDAQPYAPHSAGEPGLVLIYPDGALLEDTCENFHLFLNMLPMARDSRQVRYLGTYTKVPIVHTKVEKEEWRSLPPTCRNKWLRRICTTRKCDVRDALARISSHKQSQAASGALPSTDAIRQNPRIITKDIKAAFDTGQKEMEIEVIKYVRYDRGIATSLQKHDSA